MHTALLALVLKYTVVMAGHPAGSEMVTVKETTRTIDFEYNDRGRGPKTHTVMAPGSIVVSGVDYFKAPVSETFADGAESAIPQLVKAQDDWHAGAAREMAARLTHRPRGGGVVITNARIFDPLSRRLLRRTNIVIRGNRVQSVGAHDAPELEHIDA